MTVQSSTSWLFFFSSRRRHTRSLCDWSSDVCSSDLGAAQMVDNARGVQHVFAGSQVLDAAGIVHHLRGALEQSLRAAEVLGLRPEIIKIGRASCRERG